MFRVAGFSLDASVARTLVRQGGAPGWRKARASRGDNLSAANNRVILKEKGAPPFDRRCGETGSCAATSLSCPGVPGRQPGQWKDREGQHGPDQPKPAPAGAAGVGQGLGADGGPLPAVHPRLAPASDHLQAGRPGPVPGHPDDAGGAPAALQPQRPAGRAFAPGCAPSRPIGRGCSGAAATTSRKRPAAATFFSSCKNWRTPVRA